MAGGSVKSDDELARTVTASSTSSASATGAPALGDCLGRFRLERELGAGGMGVVHAAFDPDLERRVALKVLRVVDDNNVARERLLREAKAMARLAHPNVVTVHEVGTASGRDYVAMELIDGTTLADWLRAEPRSQAEVVSVFVAAGRGLAAAHAAGLVHRDFKPHNVLRHHDGRIVVTDFGLARGVETTAQVALDATLRMPATATTAPSVLVTGLTATGSMLGTPAYMAPEQWTGDPVGPAADQFAFCVGLWEALTGERPFRGTTIDELKEAVRCGVDGLDDSKLPRRLRRAIRRGLAADPAHRWPSMDALLGSMTRAARRPGVALMSIGGALVGAAIVFMLAARGDDAGPTCDPPAIAAEQAWSPQIRAEVVAKGLGIVAKQIDTDLEVWRTLRGASCQLAPTRRAPRLACLDGIIARTDATSRALAQTTRPLDPDRVLGMLVDPRVCDVDDPPKLSVRSTADVVRAYGLLAEAEHTDTTLPEAEVRAFADRKGLEPCARTVALLATYVVTQDVPRARAAIGDAVTTAEECGDDRLRASALVYFAPLQYEFPAIGPRGQDAIKKAQNAVARVPQADLVAQIDLMRAHVVSQQNHWTEALELAQRASDAYASRGRKRGQLVAESFRIGLLMRRGEVADVVAARDAAAKWRQAADAIGSTEMVEEFEGLAAAAQFQLGDVAGFHAAMIRSWHPPKDREGMPSRAFDGIVVDQDGKPAAGALVISSRLLYADSVGLQPFAEDPIGIATTRTDASGHFAITKAPPAGGVIAELGKLRSLPLPIGDHVKLVLERTRRLEGRVELGGVPYTEGVVIVEPIDVKTDAYRMIAPIKPDGSFELEGAPTGRIQAGFGDQASFAGGRIGYQPVPASTATTRGIELTTGLSDRNVDVIARSAVAVPLDTAQVVLLHGRQQIANVGDLLRQVQQGSLQVEFARHLVGEQVPHALIDKVRPGDLFAHFTNVVAGELTACAIALNGDLTDRMVLARIQAHISELQLKCEPVGVADTVVTIEAPMQKRLD